MQILAVGIATLDIINYVDVYPHEDDEVRALRQRICRGGNATNSLVVLSQLGYACHWAGTLADEPDSRLILEDLARYQIDIKYVCIYKDGKVPTSYVVSSAATGSRTIVHYRDLPEYRAEDFRNIDTKCYDWIHFEGRNVPETRQMLQHLKQTDPLRPASLEIEKSREDIESLYAYPDVLIFSRAFALAQGYTHPTKLFATVRQHNQTALAICAWGEQGAWLQTPELDILHVPAVRGKIVDTLAAGDVFNAGIIHGLLKNLAVDDVLATAVQLAGDKCAQYGLGGLVRRHA
jgi:ketohexokinase